MSEQTKLEACPFDVGDGFHKARVRDNGRACPECGQPYVPTKDRGAPLQKHLIKQGDDYQVNLIADALIDCIRAPYSRSWLVSRIKTALEEPTNG